MLRTHLIIYSILLLLCIPVYLIDHYSLKSSGSNWISLDFSGLLIKGYVLLIGIHITISTLAIFYYHHFSLFKIHLFSAILSLAFIGLGFFLYNTFDHYNSRKKYTAQKEQRKIYFNDIRLIRWRFLPDRKNPKEIYVDLEIASPGRFSAHVQGNEDIENRNNIFSSDGEVQRMVKGGETIHYVFPLTINNPGQANNIEFTFYLFKHPVGQPGADDVAKIYKDSIDKNDDGSFYYEKLAPPLEAIPE